MNDQLLDMQRVTFTRLLQISAAATVAGLLLLQFASIPLGGVYLWWAAVLPLNWGMHQLARTRLRPAMWLWLFAVVVVVAFSIPWNDARFSSVQPYSLMLVIIIAGLLLSRGAAAAVTATATVLMPLAIVLTGQAMRVSWASMVSPIALMWAAAGVVWLLADQLVSALEWNQKTQQQAVAQAEDLRQNRDALQKSLLIRDNLNAQLQEANAQAVRRAVQLETMAELSRSITMLLDLEKLLPEAVNLICGRFGYYAANVFLVDEATRTLVLRASDGPRSRALLAGGLRLPLDSTSLNGHAASTGQAQIVGNLVLSPYARRDDVLSETVSEAVVPLSIGQQIVGTLDVQSQQANAISQDEVAVLQNLAGQMAVAIQNTRSFERAQAALREVELSNRLLTRQGWADYVGRPSTVRQAELGSSGAGAPGAATLTVPLEYRGQPLGQLTLQREAGHNWSPEEAQMVEAIALQTVLAADNARLIEQTQQALEETRVLYETSREITSAGEMSEVLSAVLDNLARTGIQTAAVALFDAPSREDAQYIELAGAWDYLGTPRMSPGTRFPIAAFPLFDRITSEAALVSADLLTDPGIDEVARQLLCGLGFRAMAVTPLSARGQWIGVLFALLEQPHTFTAAELDFHRALADQTAVAIDNRRLFAETQRRAEREARIRQITTRIRAASDVQGVMEATAAELARSLGVSRAIVRLATGDERSRP